MVRAEAEGIYRYIPLILNVNQFARSTNRVVFPAIVSYLDIIAKKMFSQMLNYVPTLFSNKIPWAKNIIGHSTVKYCER